MKKFLSVSIFILFSILLVACSDGINNSSIDYKNLHASFYNIEDETDDIDLSLLEDEINTDDEAITIIYENLSKNEYTYNDKIQIEIFLNDEWYILPVDEHFIRSNALYKDYILLSNDIYYHELQINKILGELISGNYRIIKSFNKDDIEFFKSVEFEVI